MAVDPGELDRAWGDEMLRRSQQIAAGEVRTMAWEEVLALVAESRRLRDGTPVAAQPCPVIEDTARAAMWW